MSAPHVAGAAALVLAAGTAKTPAEVARVLLAGAAVNKITNLPAGTPNLLLQTPAAPAAPVTPPVVAPVVPPVTPPVAAPVTPPVQPVQPAP